MNDEKPPADGADASFCPDDIEDILAKVVAQRANVPAPYVRHCRWVWLRDGEGRSLGPSVVVKVTRAPNNLVRLPVRRDPIR